MSTSGHRNAPAYATGPTTPYPWGWLGVVAVVIVLMMTGAGWLYQKNGEWPAPATQDHGNTIHEKESTAIGIPPDRISAAQDVGSPRPSLTPSTPLAQSASAVTELPEPIPPPSETIDAGADRRPHQVAADAPPRVETRPPSGTYIIQHGDTLMTIATQVYGDVSLWSAIAEANPEADPKRLRVGQVIKLPPRPSQSEKSP